jgi:hypothetical protein
VRLYTNLLWSQGQTHGLLEESTDCVLSEVRDVLSDYPFLRYRSAETVGRVLRMTRQVRVSEFDVAIALEALRVDGEVLS